MTLILAKDLFVRISIFNSYREPREFSNWKETMEGTTEHCCVDDLTH